MPIKKRNNNNNEKNEKKYSHAIHNAIRRGSMSDIKKLLKKTSVSTGNSAQQTPLHTACIEGKYQIAQYLVLKKKANVNLKDRDGFSPLHCACQSGHLKIVEILISQNAEVCVETVNGFVPMDYFVRIEEQDTYPTLFERLFRTMIRKGSDINRKNHQGDTPLHIAAQRGKILSVKLLILNQANINETNKNGETALHLATKGCYSECIKILLENNADYSIIGNNGNALQVALKLNKSVILDIYKDILGDDIFERSEKIKKEHKKEHKREPSCNVVISESEFISPATSPNFVLSPLSSKEPIDVTFSPRSQRSITEVNHNSPEFTGSWNSYKLTSPISPKTNTNPTPLSPGFLAPENLLKSAKSDNTSASAETSPRSPFSKRKRAVSSKTSKSTGNLPAPAPKTVGSYVLGDCIGSGGYGNVYIARDGTSGHIVAVKQIPLRGIPKEELETTMCELELLQRLEYIHITKCLGFLKNDNYLSILLEYIEGGSLLGIIEKFGGVEEIVCARYIKQTLLGLAYLHKKNIIHRDIKCANILVTNDGKIKLADFGIASVFDPTKIKPCIDDDKKDAAGSPYWIAPEVIQLKGASPSSDIWSVGCTVIELINGKPPYHDQPPMTALFSMVKNDNPPFPNNISKELKDFLLQCFIKNPSERPSCKDLINHKWLQNVD